MESIAKKYAHSSFTEQNLSTGGIKKIQDPRRYLRKSFQKSIFFNYENQKYSGVIKNVGRGGVFIETRAKFLFGQTIELIIPNSHINTVRRVRAWMVHSNRRGIGITFKRLFERRSGKERRHAIDRRRGLDRRKRPKPKNRHRQMHLLSPGIHIKP